MIWPPSGEAESEEASSPGRGGEGGGWGPVFSRFGFTGAENYVEFGRVVEAKPKRTWPKISIYENRTVISGRLNFPSKKT